MMSQLRGALAIGVAWACSVWCVACTSDDDSEQMQQPAMGAATGGSLVPPSAGAGGMMMTVPPPAGGVAGTPAMMPMAGSGVPNNDAGGGGKGMAGSAGSAGTSGMAGGSAGMAGNAGSAGMGGSGGMSGGAGSAGSGMGAGATFTDVYAIVSMKCGGGTTGCHVTGKSGGLQMPNKATARMNLVGVDSQECPGNKRVTAGSPDKSILVGAIEGTACVQRMPRGKPALSADEIAKFRSWVQAGALDN